MSPSYAGGEWVDDPTKKRAALEGIVAKDPTFAPAWQKLTGFLSDDDGRLHAVTMGLNGNPDAETKGMLLLNKANTALIEHDSAPWEALPGHMERLLLIRRDSRGPDACRL